MSAEQKYEHINLEYINEMADGDNEFLVQIIANYLSSIPDTRDKLVAAADTADYKQCIFYAHKLKGTFQFIGCFQLAGMFEEIEELSHGAHGIDRVRQLVAEIVKISAAITTELGDVYARAQDAA
ncbi:MAG: Hpt domain-containing protein [Bacteroidota bacterium]